MVFKNSKVYDILKWILLTVVPALNILIAGLCALYGWTWGNIVIGTIDLVAAFLGAILGIGSIQYQKQLKGDKLLYPTIRLHLILLLKTTLIQVLMISFRTEVMKALCLNSPHHST